MERRQTATPPRAKRVKREYDGSTQVQQYLEHFSNLPASIFSSRQKLRSSAPQQVKRPITAKVTPSGHVLVVNGKDLFVWNINSYKELTRFDIPLSEHPCVVTLVKKGHEEWGVLAVASHGVYRYWNSIDNKSAYYQNKIELMQEDTYFSHLEPHPTEKVRIKINSVTFTRI